MRVSLTALVLFGFAISASAAETDADVWVAKARSIIISHHLLSQRVMRCTALIYGQESTTSMAGIDAVEKHGGRCKGNPMTMPRMFSMQIDKATGQAKWDRDTGDLTMKPVP